MLRASVSRPWKGITVRSKRLIPVVLATTLGLTLTACGGPENTDPMADGKITIGIVGTTPVQDAFKEVAAQNDVTVEFVDFSDYSQPNPALKSGDIDMNWFQHIAYLADYNNLSLIHISEPTRPAA